MMRINVVDHHHRASTYIVLILINGIGRQVKRTDNNKNTFLPHISDIAPIIGALKNDKIPFFFFN